MVTSRKDGILVMELDNGYNIAINGTIEKRKGIICKEFGSSCELVAFDMEHLLNQAMFSMADGLKNHGSKVQSVQEKDDFYDTDCPKDSEIKERSTALEMMIRANTKVKMSQIVELFKEFVNAGLIICDCQIPMTSIIWDSIKMNDKLKIIFGYISFFVNPLQRLETMSIETDKKSLQGQVKDKGML